MHTAQLMPLPLTVSCFSEIQIGFTFLVLAHPGSPGQRAVKRVSRCECRMPLSCSVAISFLLFSHTRARPLAFLAGEFCRLKILPDDIPRHSVIFVYNFAHYFAIVFC